MIFSLVCVAEWPPIGERSALTFNRMFALYISISNFGYFPIWFQGQYFGSDSTISWSSLTYLPFIACSFLSTFSCRPHPHPEPPHTQGEQQKN